MEKLEDLLFIGCTSGTSEFEGKKYDFYRIYLGRKNEKTIGYSPITISVDLDEFEDFKKLAVGEIITAKIKGYKSSNGTYKYILCTYNI